MHELARAKDSAITRRLAQQYAERALQPLCWPITTPAALTSGSAVRHKVTCGCISTSWPPTAICKPLLTR
ncbi:MAG: hypothetical protein ACR5LG_02475 [Sodalis sp. (in: enterobacteria)]|uniref:hypothetical protein n=1 Tax=Sodalis sp. (in: enterobacteria) TaxID=1898979 RepID=UPI003F3FE917